MGFIVAPALFGMRVQSKKFSSTFLRDFDGINSIVSTWFARSSQERNSNRQLTWYTRQDAAPGVCWGCVIASNIAVAQFHNPSRCAAKTSLSKMSSVYQSLKLWGSDIWASYGEIIAKEKVVGI